MQNVGYYNCPSTSSIARQALLLSSCFRARLSPIFAGRLVAGKVLGRRYNKTEHQQRWAVGRVFGLKWIGFEEFFRIEEYSEITVPNSAFAKCGQD